MWLKYHSILFSINCLQSKKTHLIELRRQKKHDNLIIEKRLYDCTQRNSNKVMKNLTNITLTQEEMRFGLKHGVALRSKNLKLLQLLKMYGNK